MFPDKILREVAFGRFADGVNITPPLDIDWTDLMTNGLNGMDLLHDIVRVY